MIGRYLRLFQILVSRLTQELFYMAQNGAPERTALISIMDHKRDCIERYPSPRVLRLCFDDADNRTFWQNLMTEEQADAICAFVLRYAREIDTDHPLHGGCIPQSGGCGGDSRRSSAGRRNHSKQSGIPPEPAGLPAGL